MALQDSRLASLPSFSAEQVYAAQALPGGVSLILQGESLPYDHEANVYYLPVSKETALADRRLATKDEPGVSYGLLDPGDGTLILCARTDSGIRTSTLVFTSLPVIALDSDGDALPGDEAEHGVLTYLSGEDGRLTLRRSEMEINLRGNTSRRLPKKSYRVKIIDESGEKSNLSLAGLRSDDDWILNPMYSDTSKVREPLAYWLWEQINSSSSAAASSRAAYAEVILNGAYWGLYAIQERIDRKQVGGDKQADILYKVIANDRPTTQELTECTDSLLCHGFEISHAGTGVGEQRWLPAASYMAALNGEENPYGASLSLENTVDYGLFAMLTQAYDCHFKNQFLNCVYNGSGYTLYKIPWDLNHTFGDAWNGDSTQTNYLDYVIGDELVLDSAFQALLTGIDDAAAQLIRSRWEALRRETITEENITQKAYSLYLPLQSALERDTARWSQSGMGDGNAQHIRDIEVFIRNILPRIDEFVRSL